MVRVYSACLAGHIYIWDAQNGKVYHHLKAKQPISRIVFAPKGNYFATAIGEVANVWTYEKQVTFTNIYILYLCNSAGY